MQYIITEDIGKLKVVSCKLVDAKMAIAVRDAFMTPERDASQFDARPYYATVAMRSEAVRPAIRARAHYGAGTTAFPLLPPTLRNLLTFVLLHAFLLLEAYISSPSPVE